jgi:hypothetical protein
MRLDLVPDGRVAADYESSAALAVRREPGFPVRPLVRRE